MTDIVLKSEGTQYFSYTYVGDAVTALLYTLFYGENGEAYNVSDDTYDITLKDLASTIAKQVGKEVIFDLPSEEERKGYSTATKAIMVSDKIKKSIKEIILWIEKLKDYYIVKNMIF